MKILVLIICGGNCGNDEGILYNKMFEMQQQWWDKHPNIDIYSVKMDNTIEQDMIITNNNILVKGKENHKNILHKTIKALNLLTDSGRSDKYKFIVRSNISTVIDLDKLYDYFKNKNNNLYTGGRLLYLEWIDKNGGITDETHFGTPFIQGCFIIFSMDIIKKILQNLNKLDFSIIDDVSLAIFIKHYTSINDKQIIENRPLFCLDNIYAGKEKLKDYTDRKYIAYRNHRQLSFSWGEREADIEEIKNQIKYIYNI